MGCSGNLNLIPPAFHVYRFRSGDMVNRKSNDWLNKIPTLSDLGQSVLFWAGKVLGLRKSLKNVASSSITGQLAQDVSSNYELCASTVKLSVAPMILLYLMPWFYQLSDQFRELYVFGFIYALLRG